MKLIFSIAFLLCAFLGSAQTEIIQNDSLANSSETSLIQMNDTLFANVTIQYDSEGRESKRQVDYYTPSELTDKFYRLQLEIDNSLAAKEKAAAETLRLFNSANRQIRERGGNYSTVFLDSLKLSEIEFYKIRIINNGEVSNYNITHRNNNRIIDLEGGAVQRLRFIRNNELMMSIIGENPSLVESIVLSPDDSDQKIWRGTNDEGARIILFARKKE